MDKNLAQCFNIFKQTCQIQIVRIWFLTIANFKFVQYYPPPKKEDYTFGYFMKQ